MESISGQSDRRIDWNEFLKRLRRKIERKLDSEGGLEIFRAFKLTVFDDRGRFDGVDTHAVREHFREWSDRAAVEERIPGFPENVFEVGAYRRASPCFG